MPADFVHLHLLMLALGSGWMAFEAVVMLLPPPAAAAEGSSAAPLGPLLNQLVILEPAVDLLLLPGSE